MESNTNTARRFKLFYGSSYDRGLSYLLYLWSDILAQYPQAELHICYGWDIFDRATLTNPERKQWKESIVQLMNQKNVFHYGRIGKEELNKVRAMCGIWAYPTDFTEINCITALEAQRSGLVPVVTSPVDKSTGVELYTALEETVGSGIKIKGDIKNLIVRDQYLQELLALMGDEERWKKESHRAEKFAKDYSWDTIAPLWEEEFKTPVTNPLVSIITPTIREGWWNIMAENISKQTYKNLEWLIVDDYREDRSAIALKYAKKYKLKIKYIRGDKALGTYNRPCGLVRANNFGWQQSQGELLVWLQDFIIMPETGIESLVDLYRHNPNSLLAPVDEYFYAQTPDKSNPEDWWNGKTDILGAKSWRNPRVKYQGIRESDNPFDYEANYGAIPRKILDHLQGWWEFMDAGLGFDNTELAHRALTAGYTILVDDTNISKCINLWPVIGGTQENILNRDRLLNPPRYLWLIRAMERGRLPLVRDPKLDANLDLPFTVPETVTEKDASQWIEDHTEEIVKGWEDQGL